MDEAPVDPEERRAVLAPQRLMRLMRLGEQRPRPKPPFAGPTAARRPHADRPQRRPRPEDAAPPRRHRAPPPPAPPRGRRDRGGGRRGRVPHPEAPGPCDGHGGLPRTIEPERVDRPIPPDRTAGSGTPDPRSDPDHSRSASALGPPGAACLAAAPAGPGEALWPERDAAPSGFHRALGRADPRRGHSLAARGGERGRPRPPRRRHHGEGPRRARPRPGGSPRPGDRPGAGVARLPRPALRAGGGLRPSRPLPAAPAWPGVAHGARAPGPAARRRRGSPRPHPPRLRRRDPADRGRPDGRGSPSAGPTTPPSGWAATGRCWPAEASA
jgi:hypothetical protein